MKIFLSEIETPEKNIASACTLFFIELKFFLFFLLENKPMEVIASEYTSQSRRTILNFDGQWAVPLARADHLCRPHRDYCP